MATVEWARAVSIDDVLERMAAIDADLAQDDGVAYFNRMYWQVTRLVDAAVDSSTFEAGEFLARLDVHFANRFFEAYAADLDGTTVSAAWAPLFEGRARDHTLPIQFAPGRHERAHARRRVRRTRSASILAAGLHRAGGLADVRGAVGAVGQRAARPDLPPGARPARSRWPAAGSFSEPQPASMAAARGTDVPAPRARTSAARRACGTTRPGGAPSSRVRRPAAPRSARPPGR